jgi:hypothetical protein
VRILADHHHGVLWEALALLFVDRAVLGPAELWAWADGQYVARRDTLEPWPIVDDFPPRGVWAVSDAFVRAHPPDVVLATAPSTRPGLASLAREHGALFVEQLANEWDEPIGGGAVLRSMNLASGARPGIVYHPEFHRVPAGVEVRPAVVAAFHNSLLTNGCGHAWAGLARAMPERDFRLYGAPPWEVYPHQVAAAMGAAGWIYHDKTADGYGFAVHEAFASGRPVAGHARHYAGKLAEPLWLDGVTCLDLGDNLDTAAARIRATDPVEMGARAAARFAELVDFAEEARAIGEYLGARLG